MFSTKPERGGVLRLNLDFNKADEVLKLQPRIDVAMRVGDKELTLVEIIRSRVTPDALEDNNVNVLC